MCVRVCVCLAVSATFAPPLARLELLQVLTEGGRMVSYIESDIGPLMVQWMPGVMEGWR